MKKVKYKRCVFTYNIITSQIKEGKCNPMYYEEIEKQQEIDKISNQIEELNKTKEFGPELIKEFESKIQRYPERMEEYQYKINQITILLLNYENLIRPLTTRLTMLMN